QQAAQKPAVRDPQRELATSIADGFTLAAVGDCIIARPVSQTPGFAPVGEILHDADAAFGNFEGTAIDLTRTPAVPQAEFGGVWIIALAATLTPLSRSAPPRGQAPGRPGINALRTTRYAFVSGDELRMLRKHRDDQPPDSIRAPEKEPADELELFGVRYKAADH